MNIKELPKSALKGEFDPLSLYHHATYAFEPQLQNLFSILEMPKEYALAERFKKIESILDKTFRLELMHHLHLKQTAVPSSAERDAESEHHNPQIILHLLCLLECTDSIEYIANYLELTPEEVKELIRELHNTFSIDSLVSRIRQYYQQNKNLREEPICQKREELLGMQSSVVPKDTTEARRQRLRRKYGHLGTVFTIGV